jgi:O-antigen ligase
MPSNDVRFIADPGRRWDRAVLSGTMSLLLFSILAFGATEPWSIFVLRAGATILLLGWATGRIFSADPKIVLAYLFAPTVVFMGLVALQWGWLSAYRYATMTEGMNYLAYGVLLFLVVQTMRTEDDARRVVLVLGIFGGLLAMAAIAQGLAHTDKLLFIRTPRIASNPFGPYVNHNHYAGMMEMLSPFLLTLALSDRVRGPLRLIIGGGGLIAAMSIFLSASRGGMVAFALEAAFLAAVALPFRGGRKLKIGAALGVIAASGLMMWLGGDALLRRIGSMGQVGDNWMRLDIARDSVHAFAQRPVLGWGLGTFPIVYPEFRSFYYSYFVNQAHNDWAQLLVEMGLAGLAVALWYLVTMFRYGLRKVGDTQLHAWSSIAAVAAMTGCVGLLVHSLFDYNLHVAANAALFFFLGGIAVAPVRVEAPKIKRRAEVSTVLVH